MFQFAHGLQTRTFPRGHVALFPSDDWNLRRGHCNERRRSIHSFHADTRSPELQNVFPNVAILTLTIPFELLKAWRENLDLRQPRVYAFLVLKIKLTVLLKK